MVRDKNRGLILGICTALIGVTLLVYWPAWNFDFLSYDDAEYVSKNAQVLQGLTSENIAYAFEPGHASNWHPLTWLSHMLDVQLFGPKPGPIHLVNLLFHIANTILLFLLLRRITGALWRSAFVAALFALHPLHVESVAWIAERKDVLSGLFFILTVWAYSVYAAKLGIPKNANSGPSKSKSEPALGLSSAAPGWYSLTVVLFALGLMSKPMLVTLPFVLLLLDFWPLNRAIAPRPAILAQEAAPQQLQWSNLLREKIPFFVLAALSCFLTMEAQESARNISNPLSLRLGNAVMACVDYLQQTFWPTHLAIFYPYPVELSGLGIAAALTLLLIITVTVVAFTRKTPFLSVGWFWYLGMLVPVLGIVQVGSQARADRYTYLPLIGIFILVVWAAASLASRYQQSKSWLAAAGVAALLALSATAHQQVQHWRTSEALFTHAANVTKDNYTALGALGMEHVWRGDFQKAMISLNAAVEPARRHHAEKGINYYMGVALQMQGKYDEALPWLQDAIVTPPLQPDLDYRLGMSLLEAGRPAEAEAPLQQAVAARPHNPDFALAMAMLKTQQGQFEQAEAIYKDLVRSLPGMARARKSYGDLLAFLKRPAEAASEYEAALNIVTNASIKSAYAATLLQLGKTNEAILQFNEVLQSEPTNAAVHLQLADLLTLLGQNEQAVAHYDRVLASAPNELSVLNNLAWLLATCPDDKVRNGKRAVELAQRACQLTEWKEAFLIGTLAAANAEAGNFTNAVTMAEKARDVARANKSEQVAKRNEELMQLYRSGKPLREVR